MNDCLCAICLDDIHENKNICILECGHKLHSSCLCSNFVFKRYCCPLCKKNIIDEELINKQNNNNIDFEHYNHITYYDYEAQLENKRLRQSQYKNYPILKKMYKEVLEFKKLLKDTKKNLNTLNKELSERNMELLAEIKDNKKKYKNYYQKYLRRERRYILKANNILNIQEDISIF
jgi:hypothetical protein